MRFAYMMAIIDDHAVADAIEQHVFQEHGWDHHLHQDILHVHPHLLGWHHPLTLEAEDTMIQDIVQYHPLYCVTRWSTSDGCELWGLC